MHVDQQVFVIYLDACSFVSLVRVTPGILFSDLLGIPSFCGGGGGRVRGGVEDLYCR